MIRIVTLIAFLFLGLSVNSFAVINWQGGSTIIFDPDEGLKEVFGTLTLAATGYSFNLSASSNSNNIEAVLFIDGQPIATTSGSFTHSGAANTFKLEIKKPQFATPNPCDEIVVTINFQDIFLRDVGSSTFRIKIKEKLPISYEGVGSDPFGSYARPGYTHLLGCGPANIKTNGLCSTDLPPIFMLVTEATYDPISFNLTPDYSTEVKRQLTNSERQDLISTGFEFTQFVSGSNSITLTAGKYYFLTVVNVRNGGWIPTYKFLHVRAGTHDYAMRDFAQDYGVEPSDKWEDKVFNSPDLWNNVPAVGNPTQHQAPDHVTAPNTQGNNMRFDLRNIGCNTSPPAESHSLRLFWTRARTDELWDEHWTFNSNNMVQSAITSNGMVPAGSEITIAGATLSNPYNANSQPLTLANIPPLSYYQAQMGQAATEVEWFPPFPNDFNAKNGSMSSNMNRPVICLLAVINDKANIDDPLIWEPTAGSPSLPQIPIYPFVKNNNNVVTRNTILMDEPQYIIDHGDGDWDHGFGTVWVNNDRPQTRPITICVDLDDEGLPADFTEYGRIELGMTEGLWESWVNAGMNSEDISMLDHTLLQIEGTHGCLFDIPVLPGADEQIGLRFVYDGQAVLPTEEEQYDYVLSAVYEESQQGSNSVFQVRVPTVSPVNGEYKKANTALTVSDDLAFLVYPNPSKGHFEVSATLPISSNYSLIVTDLQGREIKRIEDSNTTRNFSHSLDLTNLANGLYTLTLKSANHTEQQSILIID